MSSSSANDLRTALHEARSNVSQPGSIRSSLQLFGFWAAIALPFLYVPLAVTGLNDGATILAFLTLLALNVVALFVGREYGREMES
jgi:Flp pilus assembly protein TadB